MTDTGHGVRTVGRRGGKGVRQVRGEGFRGDFSRWGRFGVVPKVRGHKHPAVPTSGEVGGWSRPVSGVRRGNESVTLGRTPRGVLGGGGGTRLNVGRICKSVLVKEVPPGFGVQTHHSGGTESGG